jgi:phosphoribosylamine--glycine ligase
MELEGNEVELFIKDKYHKQVWDSLIPKAKTFKPREGDVVVFDFSGSGKLADSLRKSGFATYGGSEFADKLEQDRMFGLNLMEQAGIKIPLTANFDDFSVKEVSDFIGQHDAEKRWVFKANGDGLPCSLTYCAKDAEDLTRFVEYVERYYGKDVDGFVLQEFIDGVVVSSEAFCDGVKFITPYNHTLEIKGFMNHCLGPATGCSGNIVWAERDETCRIIREGLAKAERLIVESGHVGQMDLNAVVNESGVYGLEWTPRMGYASVMSTAKLLEGDLAKFISDVARGQASRVPLKDGFASAVKLSIPPYPAQATVDDGLKLAEIVTPNIGVPIRGIPEGKEHHFYWYEIFDDKGQLAHSPGYGAIAEVVAIGDTVEAAFEEPYELLEDLVLPNKQYRTDLVEVLGAMHEELKEQEKIAVDASGEVYYR